MANTGEYSGGPQDEMSSIFDMDQLDHELWLLLEQHPKVIPEEDTNNEYQALLDVRAYVTHELSEFAATRTMRLVIDDDPDKTNEIYEAYIDTIRTSIDDERMRDPEWVAIYVSDPDTYRSYIDVACLEQYITERDFQEAVLAFMAKIIYHCTNGQTNEAGLVTAEYYRKVYEEVLARAFPEQFNDDWQAFIDYITPKLPMDEDVAGGALGIFVKPDIEDTLDLIEQSRQRDTDVFIELQAIAGIYDNEKTVENAQMTFALIMMQNIAANYYEVSATSNGRATRNEAVCMYGQQAGVESGVLGKIAHHLDRRYPLESIRNF